MKSLKCSYTTKGSRLKKEWLASTILLGAALQAMSAPVYYTFRGLTEGVQNVNGFASPYAQGEEVKFILAVDRDRVGETVDEMTGLAETVPGDAPGESFYAEWVAGHLAQVEPVTSDPVSYHLGLQWGHESQLLVSNANGDGFDLLQIIHQSLNIDDWTVGTTGFVAEHWFSSNNVFGPAASFELTLTAIGETLPTQGPSAIPEPGTLGLIAMGLIAVAFRGRVKLRQLGTSRETGVSA